MLRVLLAFASLALIAPGKLPFLQAAERYALLVGINEYGHQGLRRPPLRYAVADVTELGDVLDTAGYHVTLLTDVTGAKDWRLAPTKSNIERYLRALARTTKPGDTLIVALAGHGLQFQGEKDAFFCPVDARPFLRSKDTLVSLSRVYDELETSFASIKVVLVDACRNDPTPSRGLHLDSGPVPPPGVGVLLSCSAGERAFEHESLKHGVFFHYVLRGLRREAADKNGEVTFEGVSMYVRRTVPDKVRELFPEQKPDQSPSMKATLSGKPLVLLTVPPREAPVRKPDSLYGAGSVRKRKQNGNDQIPGKPSRFRRETRMKDDRDVMRSGPFRRASKGDIYAGKSY